MSTTTPAFNEALAASATQLLDFIRKTAENAEGFVVEQAPLFIQEYLQYHFILSLVGFIVSLIAGIILIIFPFWLWKFTRSWTDEEAQSLVRGIGCIVPPIVGILILGAITFQNGMTCVKIKVAPRVYIVDTLLNKAK